MTHLRRHKLHCKTLVRSRSTSLAGAAWITRWERGLRCASRDGAARSRSSSKKLELKKTGSSTDPIRPRKRAVKISVHHDSTTTRCWQSDIKTGKEDGGSLLASPSLQPLNRWRVDDLFDLAESEVASGSSNRRNQVSCRHRDQ